MGYIVLHRTQLDVLKASLTASVSKRLAKLEEEKSQTTPTSCVFYSGMPPLLVIPKIEMPVSYLYMLSNTVIAMYLLVTGSLASHPGATDQTKPR